MKLVMIVGMVGLALVGCKKKEDRKSMCETAKAVFAKGMQQAIDGPQLNDQQKAAARTMAATADKNFMGFCMALSDADVDCMSNFNSRKGDPACAHVVADTQHKLLGL